MGTSNRGSAATGGGLTGGQTLDRVESRRIAGQLDLDAGHTAAERNRLGQFATPPALSLEIAEHALALFDPSVPIRFSDPAIGSGSFFSALLRVAPPAKIASATGVEVDPRFADLAQELWGPYGLEVITGDATDPANLKGLPRPNLVLANPPYVRHHHLSRDQKERLGAATHQVSGLKVHGLAGLYVYFMLLASAWMDDGGLGVWLVPSEFMEVNYGEILRRYLTERVTLLRIHRYDPHDVQFGDALTTSAVVFFRKDQPGSEATASFTFGGTLAAPRYEQLVSFDELQSARKWTAYPGNDASHTTDSEERREAKLLLRDLFRVQRGLATGANEFFILPRSEAKARGIPDRFLRPILPSPRAIRRTVIEAEADGYPTLPDQLALIDCDLPEHELRETFPAMWSYFQTAGDEIRSRYLVRKRNPWYRQERRPAAPFLCTYMGRGAAGVPPVRFIWNQSQATAANVYLLLYPTGPMAETLSQEPECGAATFALLNEITGHELRSHGRVYGGGLHKLEPDELGRIPADAFLKEMPRLRALLETKPTQLVLLEQRASYDVGRNGARRVRSRAT